ncbi:MAG TPA: hypothetical protein VFH43_04325 [Candidatus Kapabacteria bacterium]|nr:hypothetical protein [Candidatus Kapabacteria bacterium]
MKLFKIAAVLLVMACSLFVHDASAQFVNGDVFCGIYSGTVKRFSPSGSLLQTMSTGQFGYVTGMAFDVSGNLYATNFSASCVSKFDNFGTNLSSNYLSSNGSTPESMLFDADGDMYVGWLGSGIRKYDASGTLLASYPGAGQVDWLDLSSDQSTMLYTREGTTIYRYDVSTDVAMTPLVASGPAGNYFALRIVPSTGDVLVAAGANVYRFSSAGSLVATYTGPSISGTNDGGFFSLNLDPDNTTFWVGSFNDGNVYRVNINTGAVVSSFNVAGSGVFYGVTIYGEITASDPCIAAAVTTDPSDVTSCAGASVSFTSGASGTPSPTVQWQVSTDGGSTWNDLSGETSTTLTFTATSAQHGNQYRAVFSNDCGSATSGSASLSVNSAPVITSQPSAADICDGGSATFSVTATGSTSTQWQVSTDNGSTWTDVSTPAGSLTVTGSCGMRGNLYRAVLTNSCGSTTSDAVSLNVRCGCVRTQGYWKNHDDLWNSVTIGSHTLTHSEALAYLNSKSTDKWYILAKQLIAQYLNATVNNACYSCVSTTVTAANDWIDTYWSARPIAGSSAAWEAGQPLSSALDAYNNGESNCASHCP